MTATPIKLKAAIETKVVTIRVKRKPFSVICMIASGYLQGCRKDRVRGWNKGYTAL